MQEDRLVERLSCPLRTLVTVIVPFPDRYKLVFRTFRPHPPFPDRSSLLAHQSVYRDSNRMCHEFFDTFISCWRGAFFVRGSFKNIQSCPRQHSGTVPSTSSISTRIRQTACTMIDAVCACFGRSCLKKEILLKLVACVLSKVESCRVYPLTSRKEKGSSKGSDDFRFERI